jgi:hypothetical protein
MPDNYHQILRQHLQAMPPNSDWVRARIGTWTNTLHMEGATPPMASSDTLIRGDWVRITRAPNGYGEHVRKSHGAQIVTLYSDIAYVNLHDRFGRVTRYEIAVPRNRVEKVDKPKFDNKTSHIPDTPEVTALKAAVWKHAMLVKKRTGMCSTLETTLQELGIEKPPSGRVKATITFEIDTDIDRLIGHSTHETFAKDVKSYGAADLARLFMSRAEYSEAKTEFEVSAPPAPVTEQPVGQSTPASTGPVQVVVSDEAPVKSIDIGPIDDEDEDDDEEEVEDLVSTTRPAFA